MKAVTKKRTAYLVIIGFIILSSSIPYNICTYHARDENIHSNIYVNPPEMSKISGTIQINNNWTDAKIAGICNGSGSWNDPYIIKNLIIDGGNSGNCITIQNSNVYFRIENCTLLNAGSDWSSDYAGILLNHTSNGMIVENNCSNNMYGISIVSYSNNNTVFNNIVNENYYAGINLNTFSSNNTIYQNYANNNSVFGISISWNSHNNTVSKNTATRNIIGLELSSFSKFNIVVDNNLSYNAFPGLFTNGIRISRVENNTILNNIITHNGWEGIKTYESKYNLLSNNTIYNNGDHGIMLVRSDENRIIGNNLSFNGQNGVNFEDCKGNFVKFNTIYNHTIGIYMDDQSRCNTVLNNYFFGNGMDLLDLQRSCGENGLTPPPFNLVLISLAIIGVMILITGAILVLRNLLRIKMRNRNQIEKKEIK